MSRRISNGQQQHNDEVPQFAFSEITLGRTVGTGGFSAVFEIVSVSLDDLYDTGDEPFWQRRVDFCDTLQPPEHSLRASPSSHNSHHQHNGASQYNNNHSSKKTKKYVLKMLRTDLTVEEHVKGVEDLAVEAAFLQRLRHPHIITLRGTANLDPRDNRYFVILDLLAMTLERRMNYWRCTVESAAGFWIPLANHYCCSKAPQLHACWLERFVVLRDIAKALQYLHSQKILYRDLKPDNLGFQRGHAGALGPIQLFDFGLAKQLDSTVRKATDSTGTTTNYLLTGQTGSLRYMAPEVALEQPYNMSCDAYSFGILLWQICTLQTPFASMTTATHATQVVQQGRRPPLHASWPRDWTALMESAWHAQASMRPSFLDNDDNDDDDGACIVDQLQNCVDWLEDQDGVVPTRSSDMKAKKKIKPTADGQLDLDTRLATENGDLALKEVEIV